MNKKYKLVIFDLDGTLADTSLGVVNCVKYTQKKMGLPEITKEQLYSHVGPPMEESYSRNFGLTGDKLKTAVELHKEYAVFQGYRELTVYEGIYQLLNELRESEIKTAVATLKAQTTAEKIFKEYKMDNLFDIVIGTNSDNPKTKTQLLEECLNEVGIDREKAVLIGDSKYDAIGAEQANIDFIAVTYGFGFKSKLDLADIKYVAVCDSATQLKNMLL